MEMKADQVPLIQPMEASLGALRIGVRKLCETLSADTRHKQSEVA